ncbi:MAG: protein kinase [Myxococcota bacterium]
MGCLSEDRVLARVRGDLHAEDRAEVDAHLDACGACRRLVAAVADAELPSALDGDATAPDLSIDDPSRLPRGTRLGRYVVEEPLGGGAMGVVYAGRHETLGRPVALKVAREGHHAQAEQLRARLLREARAASAIRHPNVVTVHDVLTTDSGQPVIVMDRLEGRTLRRRLAVEGPLAPTAAVRLMSQVLGALEASHDAGVVHRDLKPDNVFLVGGRDGREDVRLVDFGIAKLTAVSGPTAQSAGLTVTGMLVGTPHYMAPEQAFAEPVDARTDLWAVGVMLYECLSGRRPVRGDQVGQILRRLARLELVPLAEAAPACPAPLVKLVDALLVERDHRPDDAAQVRAALVATSDSSDVTPRVRVRAGAAMDAAGMADTLDAHEATPRSASPWRPLALIASTVLLGGGLIVSRLGAAPVAALTPGLTLPRRAVPTIAHTPAVVSSVVFPTQAPSNTSTSSMVPAPPPRMRRAHRPALRPIASASAEPVIPAAPRPGQVIAEPPF